MRPLGVMALALLSCATTREMRVERHIDRPITARVAAVYPYSFRWDEAPIRSYQKSMDAVLFLASKNRLLLFGPDEFKVLRPAELDPKVATDLVRVLALRGLDAGDFLVFRGWAERRVARGLSVVDGPGRALASSSEDIVYVAHLAVVDGGTGRTILELSGEAQALRPEDRPEYDPIPEVTRLSRQLLRTAWAELEPHLIGPPLKSAPLEVRWLPAAAFEYSPPGQLSTRERMLAMDPLQADVERLSLYRYFDPTATPQLLHEELQLPGGLYVGEVEERLQHFLQEGDVITLVNGEMTVGPQVLQRALNLSKDELLQVKVRRGTARLEFNITVR